MAKSASIKRGNAERTEPNISINLSKTLFHVLSEFNISYMASIILTFMVICQPLQQKGHSCTLRISYPIKPDLQQVESYTINVKMKIIISILDLCFRWNY